MVNVLILGEMKRIWNEKLTTPDKDKVPGPAVSDIWTEVMWYIVLPVFLIVQITAGKELYKVGE